MPIWLRRYTFNRIDQFYRKEKEEYDKASGKSEMITENTPASKIRKPALSTNQPTYTSKVVKK